MDGVLPAFPEKAHTVSAEVERERAWVGQVSLLFQLGAELGVPEIAQVGHAVGAGEPVTACYPCAIGRRVTSGASKKPRPWILKDRMVYHMQV